MKKFAWAILTLLVMSSASESQSPLMADNSPTIPAEPSAKLADQMLLEARLLDVVLLSQTQQSHLEDLRQSLQEQLAAIRLQVEMAQLDEQEARWQVKMALASHRQGRAALLEDEQVASLQNIYNELGGKGKEPFSLLDLNPLQHERIRLLLWEQGEAWKTLDESVPPPTNAQKQALRQTHREEFERMLNKRQKAELQALKNARRHHYGLAEETVGDTPTLLDDAPDASIE